MIPLVSSPNNQRRFSNAPRNYAFADFLHPSKTQSRALFLIVLLALVGSNSLAQSASKLLPFQGRLTDQNGVAVTNGTRLVQFKIYAVPTGGSPVWAGEVHKTTVNGGLVNVLLGSKTPFTGVDFDKTLYLEITTDINGDSAITAADPPMLPRQVILPAVFAKESADSRLLANRDWTPLFGVNSPDGPIPATKLASNSITAAQIALGTITSNQIAPATINAAQIATNTITAAQIASGTINMANLATLVAEALNPPGTVVAFAGDTNRLPSGWLLCDGSPKNSSVYPRLYYAISTNWGAGTVAMGGTNDFNLPDMRGLFLRGVNGAQASAFADPDRDSRSASPAGGNSGNQVGSYQVDEFKSHTHRYDYYTAAGAGWRVHNDWGNGQIDTSAAGGNETRPKNAYVNYIIKY